MLRRGEFFPHLRKWWNSWTHMISSWWWKHKKTQEKTCSSNNIWQFRLMSQPRLFFFTKNRAWSYTLDTTGETFKNFNPSMKVPNFPFPAAPVFCRRHLVHRHPRGSMPLVWFRFPHIEIPVFQRLRWFHRNFKHRTHSLHAAPPKHLDECKVQRCKKKPNETSDNKNTSHINDTPHLWQYREV